MRALLLLAVGVVAQENPLLRKYRQWTAQYAQDAVDAEEAAKYYKEKTKNVLPEVTSDATSWAVKEMSRLGVKAWADATWQFQRNMKDPRPAKAAAAAGAAAAPFNDMVNQYIGAQLAYDTRAQELALRVGLDQGWAKTLKATANQHALQGDKKTADEMDAQAAGLMKQAVGFSKSANGYAAMAKKLHAVIPAIQNMGGQAAGNAAYWANPDGALGPPALFPFTVQPPLVLLQKGKTAQAERVD